MSNLKKKIFVALSGGVDSSVAAALLNGEGHYLTGVFINIWQPEFVGCTVGDDKRDAMRVCARLGIHFRSIDLSEEYRREVADGMVEAYKSGLTPNPDVECNRAIKFGAFLKWATGEGAEYIATGHYARLRREFPISNFQFSKKIQKSQNKKSHIKLLRSADENKDQTYFLWTLTQVELQRVLFPIGDYKKPQIRKLAAKFGLHTADKKDSQGVCFIGQLNMADFLEHSAGSIHGSVLNERGEKIGFHRGAYLYTIGQRHGFEIIKHGPESGPYYVVAKDLTNNTIIVAERYLTEPTSYDIKAVALKKTNWISDSPKEDKVYYARFRHRQKLQKCKVSFGSINTTPPFTERGRGIGDVGSGAAFVVEFNSPQKSAAPGQSLVLYDGDECLGGGIIEKTIS